MPIKPTQTSSAAVAIRLRRRVMRSRDAILWFPFPSILGGGGGGGGGGSCGIWISLNLSPPFSPIFRRGRDTNEEERGERGESEEVSGGVDRYPRSRCGGGRQAGERQANKWPKTVFVFSSLAFRGC